MTFSIDYYIRKRPWWPRRFVPWPPSWNLKPESGKGRYLWSKLGEYDPVDESAVVYLPSLFTVDNVPFGEQAIVDEAMAGMVLGTDVHETLHHVLKGEGLTGVEEHHAILHLHELLRDDEEEEEHYATDHIALELGEWGFL